MTTFSRRFGEVLHYQWAYGNGSFDLAETLEAGLAAGNAITDSAGLGNGGFRLLRPLTTEQGSDSIVWLERLRRTTTRGRPPRSRPNARPSGWA